MCTRVAFFTSMNPPYHVFHEGLIGTNSFLPYSIEIKYNIIKIPYLIWASLDYLRILVELSVGSLGCSVVQVDLYGLVKIHGTIPIFIIH